jgi:hypothetical protein
VRSRLCAGPNPTTSTARGGPVDGDWILRVGEEGKRVWRASLANGNQVTGTIIPLSSDWGTMTGSFDGEHLVISRFDEINAHLFKASLTTRGTLEGRLDSGASPQRATHPATLR